MNARRAEGRTESASGTTVLKMRCVNEDAVRRDFFRRKTRIARVMRFPWGIGGGDRFVCSRKFRPAWHPDNEGFERA